MTQNAAVYLRIADLALDRRCCLKACGYRSNKCTRSFRWPDGECRVAGKADDITAVFENGICQSAEILPQDSGELFCTRLSLLFKLTGEFLESEDVNQQSGSLKGKYWFLFVSWRLPAEQSDLEPRHERGQSRVNIG